MSEEITWLSNHLSTKMKKRCKLLFIFLPIGVFIGVLIPGYLLFPEDIEQGIFFPISGYILTLVCCYLGYRRVPVYPQIGYSPVGAHYGSSIESYNTILWEDIHSLYYIGKGLGFILSFSLHPKEKTLYLDEEVGTKLREMWEKYLKKKESFLLGREQR